MDLTPQSRQVLDYLRRNAEGQPVRGIMEALGLSYDCTRGRLLTLRDLGLVGRTGKGNGSRWCAVEQGKGIDAIGVAQRRNARLEQRRLQNRRAHWRRKAEREAAEAALAEPGDSWAEQQPTRVIVPAHSVQAPQGLTASVWDLARAA